MVSQCAQKWLATAENQQKDQVLEGDKFQNILKQINCIYVLSYQVFVLKNWEKILLIMNSLPESFGGEDLL